MDQIHIQQQCLVARSFVPKTAILCRPDRPHRLALLRDTHTLGFADWMLGGAGFLLVRSIGPEPFWFPPLETLDRGGARNEVMLHKSSTRCTHAHGALAATYTGRHSTGAHVCDKRLRDRAID